MSATTMPHRAAPAATAASASDPGREAYMPLRVAFTVAPILFSLDKCFNIMVDGTQ